MFVKDRGWIVKGRFGFFLVGWIEAASWGATPQAWLSLKLFDFFFRGGLGGS
jgi:hypothetical protein